MAAVPSPEKPPILEVLLLVAGCTGLLAGAVGAVFCFLVGLSGVFG